MTYVYGSRVSDRARSTALRELVDRHRKIFDALLASWVEELTDKHPDKSSEDVQGLARQRSAAELIEMFGEEYEQLHRKWANHFRFSPVQLRRSV